MRRRAIFVAALAIAAVGLLLGLGRGGHGSAQAAVSKAAKRTLGAGSSRFSMSVSGLQVESLSLQGAIDYASRKGELHGGIGEGFAVVFDRHTVYAEIPERLRKQTGKTWIEADQDGAEDFLSQPGGLLWDPSKVLAFLRSGSSEVTTKGTEAVRGTATTRYDGTLDVAGLAARLARQPGIEPRSDTKTVPYSVWIDGEGLARRLQLGSASSADGLLKMEFYDFGVTVDPRLPDPADVVTVDELVQSTGGTARATATATASATPESGRAPTTPRTSDSTEGGR